MFNKNRLQRKRAEIIRKKRSNFLPTLIVILFLWLILAIIVYTIDPVIFLAIPLFFIILFTAFIFTISALVGNSKRGLLIASGATLFIFLRYLGIGNLINLILVFGITLAVDYYLTHK